MLSGSIMANVLGFRHICEKRRRRLDQDEHDQMDTRPSPQLILATGDVEPELVPYRDV